MRLSRPLSANEGVVFDIQRFNVHDGPGIRTLVFLKGCSLSCGWCSNPESWNPEAEIVFYSDKCIGCGRCVKTCQSGALRKSDNKIIFYRRLCEKCGRCAQECPTMARRLVGKVMTVEQVMKQVEKDRIFYNFSHGGVAITGGEPTTQPLFLKNLLKECKEKGIHTAIETSGYVDFRTLMDILEFVDVVLLDIKHMDSHKHRELTGVPNEKILSNAVNISRSGKELIIRFPLIPGYTDSEENLDSLKKFLQILSGVRQLDILPYHSLGETKYTALGKNYPFSGLKPPNQNLLDRCKKLLESKKVRVTIGGIVHNSSITNREQNKKVVKYQAANVLMKGGGKDAK